MGLPFSHFLLFGTLCLLGTSLRLIGTRLSGKMLLHETTKRYLENVYPTKNSQFLGSMLVSHGVMLEKTATVRLHSFAAAAVAPCRAANWLENHPFSWMMFRVKTSILRGKQPAP